MVQRYKSKLNTFHFSFDVCIHYIIRVLFSFFFLLQILSLPIQAIEIEKLTEKQLTPLEEKINDLEQAIQTKDYIKLKSDIPILKRPLRWRTCRADGDERLSLNEMVEKLSEISNNMKIMVNRQNLFVVTHLIETIGWSGRNPFLYFEFLGEGDLLRWVGVYGCHRRSSDYSHHFGKESLEDTSRWLGSQDTVIESKLNLHTIPSFLNDAIQTRNFMAFRPLVSNEKVYYWYECRSDYPDLEELSYDYLTEILVEGSKEADIQVLSEANIATGGEFFLIETNGWMSDSPYLSFRFDFIESEGDWVWVGICYSKKPLN